MKKILSIILAMIILFVPISDSTIIADTNNECQSCSIDISDADPDEMYDIIYNEEGEIIAFSTPIPDEWVNNLPVQTRSGGTIISIISGVCFVVEVVFDYSCADLVRYLGLVVIDGLYTMGGTSYTGTWEVTVGYIPGCEPRHSGNCHQARWTRIS